MTELATAAGNTTAIRKAAILISTLDTKTADELLDRMTPEQQAQVRQAVMELNEIRPTEQDHVIREFMGGGDSFSDDESAGVELDASLARKLRAPQLYEVAPPPVINSPPFHALCDAGAEAIVRQLERQHPQVAAVVIAHLPPRRAAELVQRISAKLQTDVLRRVAELDQADPEVIREIEQELEQLLSGEIRAARNRHAGMSNVSAILEAAGNDRAALLENLVAHDREFANLLSAPPGSPFANSALVWQSATRQSQVVAERGKASAESERTVSRGSDRPESNVVARRVQIEQHSSRSDQATSTDRHTATKAQTPSASIGKHDQIRPSAAVAPSSEVGASNMEVASAPHPLPFEQLVRLTDDGWKTLMQNTDPKIMLLALAGASEDLVARIMRQLPTRESQDLRRRLEQIGPIRLDDIDRAQQYVARCAAELTAQGKLRLDPRRNFVAAA